MLWRCPWISLKSKAAVAAEHPSSQTWIPIWQWSSLERLDPIRNWRGRGSQASNCRSSSCIDWRWVKRLPNLLSRNKPSPRSCAYTSFKSNAMESWAFSIRTIASYHFSSSLPGPHFSTHPELYIHSGLPQLKQSCQICTAACFRRLIGSEFQSWTPRRNGDRTAEFSSWRRVVAVCYIPVIRGDKHKSGVVPEERKAPNPELAGMLKSPLSA